MPMARGARKGRLGTALLLGIVLAFVSIGRARSDDGTIKVGILHSLSGFSAETEAPLKDVVLMLIDLQNKQGGVLGKKLEAVVVDPASNWPLFAEKARELITKDEVSVIFGGWSGKSLLAVEQVLKENNGVLFYPSREGFSPVSNVFFTGGAPSQSVIPAIDYLMKKEGVQHWVIESSESFYPQPMHDMLQDYLKSKGVGDRDISVNRTQVGSSDWKDRVSGIGRFGSEGKKTAILLAVPNYAAADFSSELRGQGVRPQDVPVVDLSMNEVQSPQAGYGPFVGHLIVSNYLPSVSTPVNDQFIKALREFTRDPKRVPSEAMEAHFIGFNMWVKAVEKAHSTDPDRVIDALPGIEVPNLSGGISKMLPNHHITKPVFIGEVNSDGRISMVSKLLDGASSGTTNCPNCPKSGACPQAVVATCTACPKSGACPQ